MSLFNTLHSFFSSWNGSSLSLGTSGPLVNTDGTPMLDNCIDVMGKPFGVMDTSAHDCSFGSDTGMGVGMFDCGSTWDSGSGGFGDGF